MKIAVLGYAGSGKTYLSDYISEKKNIPVLHLDLIKWDKEWKPIDDAVVLPQISEFMTKDDWIIDGYYKYLLYDERLESADQIVLLQLPRLTCFCRAVKRSKTRRKDGYKNDLNWWFVKFTLFGCRNKVRRQTYAEIVEKYKDKTVVLKNKRQVDEFMNNFTDKQITIEPLKPEDYHKCSNIWNMKTQPLADKWLEEIKTGNRLVFIYKINGEFIGEGALVFDTGDPDYTIPGKRIYVSRMVVKKEYRNRGIGSEILEFLIAKAKKMGYSEMSIGIDKNNVNALHLYKKYGFTEVLFDGADENGEYLKLMMRIQKMTLHNINFEYLNKPDFSAVSNDIFNILADNMEKIAPTGNSKEDDYKCWYASVSDGLKRDERQIILVKDNDIIIGFFQYYTNKYTFMMEEIQFKPEYQGKGAFRALYGFIISHIKEDIEFVEAYASISNSKSVGILEKFGLKNIGLNQNGRSYHFKGRYSDLLKWYNNGEQFMNKHLKNLNRIEFVVTMACTGSCKHCSQGDHKSSENIDKALAADAVRKISEEYNITSVMTFGGEPLLCPETVCEIHKAAREINIPQRQLITNGYFSRDSDKIKIVAKEIIESGVNEILLSVDAFHQETIPLEYVIEFAKAVKTADISFKVQPAWLISTKADNHYNNKTREILYVFNQMGIETGEGNVVFPSGNALKYLSEYFDLSNEIKNPYDEDPSDVRAICFSANGDILGSNIYKQDIIEILSSYRPE